MSALRVARAATGRTRVLKFDGCYHGHADSMLVRAGSGLAGQAVASSDGVSPAVAAETLVAPLDDDRELDRIFEAHGPEIAAVIVEPLPANYGLLPQRDAWLHGLADRCRRSGALLIFDEVISGFRVGKTGMAGRLGLRPDLVTFGKVIGGGFPVGAYAGRKVLMERVAPAGKVYQAGTLSANPIGMRAGLASLRKFERAGGWTDLDARGAAFCAQLADGFRSLRHPLDVVRDGSIFWIHPRTAAPIRRPDRIPQGHAEWFAIFFHAAIARGVYLPPSPYEVGFLSLAHDADALATAAWALVAAANEADPA
jgi:glutamate-1-semialdehyde 2,1-aminomutase